MAACPARWLGRCCLLAAAAGLGLSAGCTQGAATPSEPSVPSPRVVSLTPSVTDLIVGLGAGQHLVGVTALCDAPGVPVVGDMRPDPERTAARRPDLVVAGAYPFNASDLEALRALGLSVLGLPLDSLAQMRQAVLLLGERLGVLPAARALAEDLDRALDEARAAARAWAARRPRVLLVFDIDGGHVYTTGGGDHLAELLDVAGGVNVAAGGPRTTRLSLERVMQLEPDLILHAAPTPAFPTAAAARAFWCTLAEIPAVIGDRVEVWPDNKLTLHGATLPEQMRRLSGLVGRVAAELAGPTAAP